ncbi:MAG: glycosyltransferase family A protein [Nocardioides sp.]
MSDPLADIAAEPQSWTASVRDLLDLRTLAVDGGKARVFAIRVESGASILLRPRAEWPALERLRGRRVGGAWLLVARFAKPVPVAALVTELARQAVWRDDTGNEGLWVEGSGTSADVPPDLGTPAPAGDITRRAVVAPLPGPALDERVLNPCGFVRESTEDVISLPVDADLGDALVASLRSARGVRVDASTAVETVAGLAMAGVPLVSPGPLDPALDAVSGLVTRPVDLSDPLAREEHSLELRRAALDAYGLRSWRRRVAGQIGVRLAPEPTVSVLLATRREEMLDFALRQVARQRGVSLELVLATHGFEVSPARVAAVLGSVPFVLAPQPAETLFGDVLQQAVTRASGEVLLKMDDDDWYSPDAIADLLRARLYSGAEIVGMPADVHYLSEPDLTVSRGHAVETPAAFVAGGTMMLDRSTLLSVGGFRPVRKFVDAQLLAAVVAAGGTVYRTHGLGYVLRRNPTGHTWQVDLDYLLDPSRTTSTTPGFAPSRLMEIDPQDLPSEDPS